jgi:hypothetical protein
VFRLLLAILKSLFTMAPQPPPSGPAPPHYRPFTITLRHATLGRTPLDEWSALRRDLYLTTHNTHNRQTSIPPEVFEPTILASERPQTHVLDGAAIGIGEVNNRHLKTPHILNITCLSTQWTLHIFGINILCLYFTSKFCSHMTH